MNDMISTLEDPKVSDFKLGIDLNEKPFQSKWRLMSVYRSLASEHKIKKATINKTLATIEKETSIKKIVKLIDKDFGDYVVFYYGTGDEDPLDATRNTTIVEEKKTKKSRTKKTKTSMSSLEENLIKATKE